MSEYQTLPDDLSGFNDDELAGLLTAAEAHKLAVATDDEVALAPEALDAKLALIAVAYDTTRRLQAEIQARADAKAQAEADAFEAERRADWDAHEARKIAWRREALDDFIIQNSGAGA